MTVKVRLAPPFKPRLRKLFNGRWCATPLGFTFFTAAGETPSEAYWALMKICGWNWTGTRWEKWL